MQKPIKTICQVCGDSLENGIVVYCTGCATPHHEKCWKFARQCSTFACGCHQYENSPPGDKDCSDKQVVTIRDSENRPIDGRKTDGNSQSSLSESASPQTVPPQPAPSRNICLDRETRMEVFLRSGAAFLLFFPLIMKGVMVIMSIGPDIGIESVLQELFPCALLLSTIKLFIDFAYIIEDKGRVLLYRRTILGYTKTWLICHLEGIEEIGVEVTVYEHHKRTIVDVALDKPDVSYSYGYSTIIMLPDKIGVQGSEVSRDLNMVRGYSRRLAKYVGCKFTEPDPHQPLLKSSWFGIPMELIKRELNVSWIFAPKPLWDSVVFFLSAILTIACFLT